MKNLTIVGLFVLGIMTACTNSEETDMENLRQSSSLEQYQQWQLVEMSGSMANVPPASGSDMEWQEYYRFYPDSTFIKSRTRDGSTIEKSGTYSAVTLEDGEYLELTYPSENDLIGNCSGELKELLFFESEAKLIGTWQACDGPGLVYEKVEEDSSDSQL